MIINHRIKAIIVRHLYNFRHSWDRLTDGFYWPAMDIILWGLTSRYLQLAGSEVQDIILVLLTGLVFWQTVWRGQYEITVNLLEEIWNRNLVNLFATPLRVEEWVAAVLILGLLKMTATIGFAILLTWALYSVNLFTFGWLLLPFFASLLMVGWWVGLLVAGIIIRFGHQFQTLAWAGVYLLAPFSAIYYPLESLPLWVQKVARVFPSAYIFEGMRYSISQNALPWQYLFISFGLNFIYLVLAYFFFQASFKKSQEKGLARLE